MIDPSADIPFQFTLPKQNEEDTSNDEDNQNAFVFRSDQERRDLARKNQDLAQKVGLFTTSGYVVPGWRVAQTLPLITARRVLGVNAWQDFLIAIRDMVGGRSEAAETAFGQMELEVFRELQLKAVEAGGQAVVGVNVQFGEISGGGKGQLFYAAAQGTPVVLEQLSQPQIVKPTR